MNEENISIEELMIGFLETSNAQKGGPDPYARDARCVRRHDREYSLLPYAMHGRDWL